MVASIVAHDGSTGYGVFHSLRLLCEQKYNTTKAPNRTGSGGRRGRDYSSWQRRSVVDTRFWVCCGAAASPRITETVNVCDRPSREGRVRIVIFSLTGPEAFVTGFHQAFIQDWREDALKIAPREVVNTKLLEVFPIVIVFR